MWQYTQADHIAEQYDDYHSYNSLFDFDSAVLARHFAERGTLVDLGCGSGRLLMPFARRGYPCIAVDLSMPMLRVVGEKAARENVRVDRLRANIVELDCLAADSADYCICMFATLGMIRGAQSRHRALAHVRRILKPGGLLVLHVHNRWYNLFDPQGRWWLLSHLLESRVRGTLEPGDKFFDYRGIPNMFHHVFTKWELTAALRRAGLEIVECIALDTQRRHALRWPWLLGRLRANGWIVVCRAPR